MNNKKFSSKIKFTSKQKGAKPYRSYLTPAGLVRWKQVPEFIQVRGRTYYQHITSNKRIRWIEAQPNNLPFQETNTQTCDCHYCHVCDTATMIVEHQSVNLASQDNNLHICDCHYCSICSTATIIIDTFPTALAANQEIDENYHTIFVQDENGIYPIYHDDEGNLLV
jgi:hypothetical protein